MQFSRVKRVFGLALMLGVVLASVGPMTARAADPVTQFTIRFDNNDGSGTFEEVTKTKGQGISVQTTKASHVGYDFIGWAYDPLATSSDFIKGSFFKEDRDVTLYAIWRRTGESEQYYLKYKRHISVQDQSCTYGEKLSMKVSLAEEGPLSFKSANTKILKFSGSKGVPTGCGIVKVTVAVPEDGMYAETSKTVTVTVKPSTVKISKLSSPSRARVSCSWKKCKSVTGYQIYIGAGDRTTYMKWKKTSFTAGAKSGSKYTIKVRAYKKSGGKTVYGKWSKAKKVRVK